MTVEALYRWLDDWLDAETGQATAPPEAPPLALHYPLPYVLETWAAWQLHHVLPAAGGYDDQDWQLMQDWRQIDWHLAQRRHQRQHERLTSAAPRSTEMWFHSGAKVDGDVVP